MAMTPEEHELIVEMLTIQMQKFQVLLDVLQNEGRLSLANLSQIESVRSRDFGSNIDLRNKIAADYRAAADRKGVDLPPAKERI